MRILTLKHSSIQAFRLSFGNMEHLEKLSRRLSGQVSFPAECSVDRSDIGSFTSLCLYDWSMGCTRNFQEHLDGYSNCHVQPPCSFPDLSEFTPCCSVEEKHTSYARTSRLTVRTRPAAPTSAVLRCTLRDLVGATFFTELNSNLKTAQFLANAIQMHQLIWASSRCDFEEVVVTVTSKASPQSRFISTYVRPAIRLSL